MRQHVETGSWREVKLNLRFLGGLQGLFEGDGIFTVLEDLFSRAVELQTESSEDVCSDRPAYLQCMLNRRSYWASSLSR